MDLRKWNEAFRKEIEKYKEEIKGSDSQRTNATYNVIHSVKEILKYHKHCICKQDKLKSQEYLTIDVMWVDDDSYQRPDLVIEIENDDSDWYNLYSFWKLLCINCKSKILISFINNNELLIKKIKKEMVLEKEEEVLMIFGKKKEGTFESFLMGSTIKIEKLDIPGSKVN